MHAYCAVQVQIRYVALRSIMPKSVHTCTLVPATFACLNHPYTSETLTSGYVISPIQVVLLATTVHYERSVTSEVCLKNACGGEHMVYMKRG
jgi:hypothetical protein